jgi:hypothetical protein
MAGKRGTRGTFRTLNCLLFLTVKILGTFQIPIPDMSAATMKLLLQYEEEQKTSLLVQFLLFLLTDIFTQAAAALFAMI